MKSSLKGPFVLIVLDGWGYREETDYNAISAAAKPTWDYLWSHYPHTIITGSGSEVGLPPGQMGNSEVGHLHMGAGRLVPQDLMRIDNAIANKEFFHNAALVSAIDKAKNTQGRVHVVGLLSPGGVHSHEHHIHALIELAAQRGLQNLFLHAILDGRDTPPRSALASIAALEKKMKETQCGQIASMIGRYYAMDRDHRWKRTQAAYDLYTEGKAHCHTNAAALGLELAYERNESDEFVKATSIHADNTKSITVQDNDIVIFMNFRADRARQLTRTLTDPHFKEFTRKHWPRLLDFITLTQYATDINATIAFPPMELNNTLAEYLSQCGLKQLHIAETEKYAHVTFFFNGGIESPFPEEDRILISSPHVETYDIKPEMSAFELTDRLVSNIISKKYDFIIVNYANPDMVGHTGDFNATVKAIEVIDQCLTKIVEALKKIQGEAIITADHGNAEFMYNIITNQPHTAHTSNQIPFIYIGRPAKITSQNGTLSDIAPTILYLMDIRKPVEMTGQSLVTLQ